ncbi:MAG: hypothetical protein ACR2QI_09920 [Woeseiaceae bacterium]
MLALIETLFDIIRLRKGPDAIPHSAVLLVVIIALWLFSGLVMILLTAELDEKDFVIGSLTGIAGLFCYAAIVVLSGKSARLMQTVMALLGCGSLITLMFVAGNVFLPPFLSENISKLVVTLILLWTVPVEGHIISRTIERHWYVGVVAAMAIFIFQLILYSAMDPATITPT